MTHIRIVVGWRHCSDLRFFVLKSTDRPRPIRKYRLLSYLAKVPLPRHRGSVFSTQYDYLDT